MYHCFSGTDIFTSQLHRKLSTESCTKTTKPTQSTATEEYKNLMGDVYYIGWLDKRASSHYMHAVLFTTNVYYRGMYRMVRRRNVTPSEHDPLNDVRTWHEKCFGDANAGTKSARWCLQERGLWSGQCWPMRWHHSGVSCWSRSGNIVAGDTITSQFLFL